MASCRVHGVTLEVYKQDVATPLWLLCGEWTLGGQEGMKEMREEAAAVTPVP